MCLLFVLASEAVSILKQYGVLEEMGTSLDLVASDILDHYRTYSLLEKLIHYPTKLDQQLAFQIEPQTKNILVEKYISILYDNTFYEHCVISPYGYIQIVDVFLGTESVHP